MKPYQFLSKATFLIGIFGTIGIYMYSAFKKNRQYILSFNGVLPVRIFSWGLESPPLLMVIGTINLNQAWLCVRGKASDFYSLIVDRHCVSLKKTSEFMIKGRYEAHLFVKNLERSIEFYSKTLGLKQCRFGAERRTAFFWLGKERLVGKIQRGD